MGRGGSRYGAGRPGHRAKAEHLQRVDIRDWHRHGRLWVGSSFSWSWTRGDEPSGSIGVHVYGPTVLALQYNITGNDGHKRDASQTIRITHTPCHYGKERPWFVCPVCQRGAGLLYMRAGRFACRHCQRVAYASQSCDALDRMWRKQAKIEARLGEHWQRPKGMRQRTYTRLVDMLEDCEYRRNLAFCDLAARLFSADTLAIVGLGRAR